MLGETQNQFSLPRAALSTRGAQKQFPITSLIRPLTQGPTDGSANGSQPFSSQEEANVIGGWLLSLTFSFAQERKD